MSSVGYATLSVIPSVKDIQHSIAKQIDAPLLRAGKAAGAKLSDGLGDGIHSGEAHLKAKVEEAARHATGGASSVFQRAGKQAGDKFGDGVKGSMSSVKSAVIGGIGAIGIGTIVGKSLSAAGDLGGATRKVKGVFGEASAEVIKWGDDAAAAFGESAAASLTAAGTFGQMFHAMNIGQTEAAGMSTKLADLVLDVAKFNNVDSETVQSAFVAAMRGRGKALAALGINLDSTTVAAEALSHGIVKASVDQGAVTAAQDKYNLAIQNQAKIDRSGASSPAQKTAALHATAAAQQAVTAAMRGNLPTLTQSQKGEAAYYAILDGTKNQQGAVERSSKSLGTQKKILAAQVANLEAKLGKVFMPTLVKMATFVNTTVIPAISTFGNWIKKNGDWLAPLAKALGIAAAAFWLTKKAVLAVNAVMALSAGIGALFGIGQAAAAVGTVALGTASAAATAEVTALNVAMYANPIGAVVAAVAVLAFGLYELYKHSKTFRDIVQNVGKVAKVAFKAVWAVVKPLVAYFFGPFVDAFKLITGGWTGFKDAALGALRMIVAPFLNLISMVLHGAAAAFGWVPGLGGKLKSARDKFDNLKEGVNRALGGIKDRDVKVTITTKMTAAQAVNATGAHGAVASRLATGDLRPGDITAYPASASVPKAAAPKGLTAAQKLAAENARQAAAAAAKAARQAAADLAEKIKDARATLKKAGADLIDSIQEGIAEKSLDPKSMTDAFKTFLAAVKGVTDAGGQVSTAAIAAIAADNARLERMAASMKSVIAKLATARDNVAAIRDNIKSLTSSVHDAVTGSFDIATAGTGTDAFGQARQVTGKSVLADIRAKVKAARNFDAELGALRKKGLSPQLIADLAAAGPAAEPEARALAAMSDKTIKSITGQYRQLSKYGSEAGTTAAGSMYQTGLKAAQGIVAGLKSQEGALESQMKHLGNVMAGAIRDALGIHSPSQVAHDISANFVKSLANSADANKHRVISSMQGISDAMSIDPRGSALGQLLLAGGGGSGASPVENHFHGVSSDPRVLAQEVSRRLIMQRR